MFLNFIKEGLVMQRIIFLTEIFQSSPSHNTSLVGFVQRRYPAISTKERNKLYIFHLKCLLEIVFVFYFHTLIFY